MEASTICQGADKRFPWLAQAQAILPVQIVWMELKVTRLPDNAIHVSEFGEQNGGVV
jgi:hypothetical protein